MNAVSERMSHPLSVNSESLQVLARWLKCNGTHAVRTQDPQRILSERYPADLFCEAETQALLALLRG